MNRKILHTAIARTAGKFADHVAVEQGDRTITHGMLNRASDRVAEALLKMGVRRGDAVGIYLEKGIPYVAALVGVLKSGGAAVPLDPDYPELRIRAMADHAAPEVLVSSERMLSEAPAGRALLEREGPRLLLSEGISPVPLGRVAGREPFAGEMPAILPEDRCYIVFTSGSTGKPKGIVGCHKGLSHFIHWQVKELGFDENTRISQFAPLSFDASFKDIFPPLITGGRVCFPEPCDRENTGSLIRWLARKKVTTLQTVPSIFRTLLEELLEAGDGRLRLPDLRQAVLAGEPLYGADVMRWREAVGERIELINFYGPTETTVIKSFHRIREKFDDPGAPVPVGKPIANTNLLVVKGNRLCREGEIGEILIRTPFMTLGYLDDPEATAKVFVENPLSSSAGSPRGKDTVYRTGDLGKYLPGGEVVCLGRADSQVKVNGVRMELGEIEGALMKNDAVARAVVLCLKDDLGRNTLACYYTLRSPVSSDELRKHLARLLPPAMIPVYYKEMVRFPVGLNGKVDRKALPKPERLLRGSGEALVPPDGETEKRLEKIWREVLGLESVGVTSPFFEIGGHSLKAMRIVSRIHRELACPVSLKAFFENATIRKLAALVKNGMENEMKNGVEKAGNQMSRRIPFLPEAPSYALSHSQRRLWLLDRMAEDDGAYGMPGAFLLTGPLDRKALEKAFHALVVRHESLRTTFAFVKEEPRQIVGPSPDSPEGLIRFIDLSGQPSPDEQACRLLRQEVEAPFSLERGPLLRLLLLKLGRERFLLALNMHHIVGDAWSVDILAREVTERYAAETKSAAKTPEPLSIQYRDFAAWQNRLLASEAGARSGAYWRDRLSGAPGGLDLPLDRVRPPVQSYRGGTVFLSLAPAVGEGLKGLAADSEATLFMVLLSLVKVLLHRYTGQTDIVVGTPVAGREHPDLDNQIGFYVNTLALRDTLEGNDSFETVLRRVRQTVVEGFEHQLYPFDLLVEEVALARDPSRSPLFDVMMVLQDTEGQPLRMGDIAVSEFPFEEGISRFDLTFLFVVADGRLQVKLNYNSDLFEAATAERIAGHLAALSRSVVSHPRRPVGTLNILADGELRLLERIHSDNTRPFPKDISLGELFEGKAAERPEAAAVICEEKCLSYGKLAKESRALACHLALSPDCLPGEPVGLMVDRGTAMVTGLLGILRSGRVYLPLDPDYPEERIRYMLADSGCRVVVCQDRYLSRFGRSFDRSFDQGFDRGGPQRLIVLERVPPDPEKDPPLPRPSGGDLAAILYTSGSTGEPKGVLLEHRGIVNTALALVERFGITPRDRILQFASISFDVSISEVFSALLGGATLVIAGRDRIADPHRFAEYLAVQGVTVAALSPLYLNALAAMDLSTLRVIATGGEPPIPEDAARYGASKRFFNAYGPTEASAYTTLHEVGRETIPGGIIPIGKPIANARVRILDRGLAQVPVGVPGEICISGPGLARGYRGRPDLTEEKFPPDPAGGGRIYRTGDMGKRLADGSILFLGRMDEQVKIRGHRIEPGEIRAALLRHPAVREAVVVKDDASGELAAYLECRAPVSADALKGHLRGLLPEYMVPHAYTVMERLPLTATGKVDRKALPPPTRTHTGERILPRTPMEETVAEAWRSILGIPAVGVHDNFFELGGNSLGSVRLASRLSEKLGARISVRQLFFFPTVAELVAEVERERAGMTMAAMPERPAADRRAEAKVTAFRSSRDFPGEAFPVDSAALFYFPDSLIAGTGIEKREIVEEWCGNRPFLSSVTETFMGRIAAVALPLFSSELGASENGDRRLRKLVVEALETVRPLGAKTVALTGLIPPATGYGLDILCGSAHGNGLPPVTTGHATITAAMLLSVERILRQAGREIAGESVGVLGTGHLGCAFLFLMLKVLPHPQELLLLNPYGNAEEVRALERSVREQSGFSGPIRSMTGEGSVPDGFYDATLVVGTVPAPGTLRVSALKPGTLVVDETVPPSFSRQEALRRLKERGDILFTEGDLLQLPAPSAVFAHVPEQAERSLKKAGREDFLAYDPHTITGCVLSGLLAARCEGIGPTTGLADAASCTENYRRLVALGFEAAALRCGGRLLEESAVAAFRSHYGNGGA